MDGLIDGRTVKERIEWEKLFPLFIGRHASMYSFLLYLTTPANAWLTAAARRSNSSQTDRQTDRQPSLGFFKEFIIYTLSIYLRISTCLLINWRPTAKNAMSVWKSSSKLEPRLINKWQAKYLPIASRFVIAKDSHWYIRNDGHSNSDWLTVFDVLSRPRFR